MMSPERSANRKKGATRASFRIGRDPGAIRLLPMTRSTLTAAARMAVLRVQLLPSLYEDCLSPDDDPHRSSCPDQS